MSVALTHTHMQRLTLPHVSVYVQHINKANRTTEWAVVTRTWTTMTDRTTALQSAIEIRNRKKKEKQIQNLKNKMSGSTSG